MQVNDNLSLPVPYTLKMLGNGTFIAKWHPPVPSPDLPEYVKAESRTSGIHALERLYDELIEKGVVKDDIDKGTDFPERILVARQNLNESQTQFGKRFGVSHAAVSEWESGKSEAPYKVIDFVLREQSPTTPGESA